MAVRILIVISLLYLTTSVYVGMKRRAAYNSIRIGDSASFVITQFGNPSVREQPDHPFARYASSKCESPCVERLWFENRLTLDIEAWSVSLGSDGRVVEKYHWISP
jgi:hypothetical protein